MAEKQQESLEEKLNRIEEIIHKMEESFQLYQAGIEQLKNCNQMLDMVEKKMQVLNLNGEW